MNTFKKNIKLLFNNLGYDLHKINSTSNVSINLAKGMKENKINLVLDVGANVGQFSKWIRNQVGYSGHIISFEPILEAHTLLTKASSGDEKWKIYTRCAIGHTDGETSINISENMVSSSILSISNLHTNVEKKSAYVKTEKTPLYRLDTIYDRIIKNKHNILLKIDTQGFEDKVLDGAKETLSNIDGIIIELSSVMLYESQILWIDLLKRIEEEGFQLWSINNGFTNNNTGQTLQIDAIFFRRN